MSDCKDAVAKRYGWTDYDNFRLNIKDAEDTWCYVAVEDVIKLEAENAELRKRWEALGDALIKGVKGAQQEYDNRGESDYLLKERYFKKVLEVMSELEQSNEQGEKR